MHALYDRLHRRLTQREDSEHGQATVRIVMVALILSYELASRAEWGADHARFGYVIGLTVIALVVAVALLGWLLWRPARSDVRRVAGMLADYGLMAMAMSAVGEPMAWIYVVVMWVTIGNGLRYGNGYLRLAVAMAVASFGITLAASDYWRQNLGLGIGLLVGLVAIPLYLSGLLRALTRATAEARRASEAKSRFLANMSHEFRTPLNGLSGMTEVLATTRLDAEQRECVGTIQASTRSLLALVEEVLDISAIEAGKIRVNGQDFSLRELLQAVDLILAPQARAKGLQYEVSVAADVPDNLCGDVGHVRQILLNLAGNAVKFTDRGRVDIRVRTVAVEPGRHDAIRLRFEIVDTGIGVPASLRPRLFDAFEQADAGLSRRHEGSGLGTTIAKGLAEAMGGSIGFVDNAGGGSCFWVELPFEPGTPMTMLAARKARALADASKANVIAFSDPFLRHRARVRSLRILVADDHEANRMVLQRLLQKAGHRVVCVSGGEMVLDALAETDFDAAIVDLHMPGVSGLDMLKQLRVMQAGGGPRTPVVILSADVTPESIRNCEQAGAQAFLAKPVVAAKLLEVLAEVATNIDTRQSATVHAREPMAADAVLDPTVLDELAELGMGEGFEREFVQQCLNDADGCLGGIARAGEEGNWERLREHAHAVKGVASNLGLARLAHQGGELMRMADWQIKSEWRRRLAQLNAALAEGRQALLLRRNRRASQDGEQ